MILTSFISVGVNSDVNKDTNTNYIYSFTAKQNKHNVEDNPGLRKTTLLLFQPQEPLS